MKQVMIQAASYLAAAGHGNDRTGLRSWPSQLVEPLARGALSDLHWSLLFTSDPSRFGRMDLMSRLGLVAVELLDAGLDSLPPRRKQSVGVCLETFTGSLDTDVRFLQTPRPSLFTYTLPSMALGEVCIRYQLQGPVLCLVAPEDASDGVLAEATEWLHQGDAEACVCFRSEALDRDVADAVFLPADPRASCWHACAMLLALETGTAREQPLGLGSLSTMCRRIVESTTVARSEQDSTPQNW
jgi:3-oxoacyl-(acyl-carrier-protein) synthase